MNTKQFGFIPMTFFLILKEINVFAGTLSITGPKHCASSADWINQPWLLLLSHLSHARLCVTS